MVQAEPTDSTIPELISTGTAGLDAVLGGGLPPDRFYLVEGAPGTGKTTLALQFLLEGAERGEKTLYVSLSETRSELESVAASHGWHLDKIEVLQLLPVDRLQLEEQYTLFHASDVESTDLLRTVLENIDRIHPTRLVLDSLSELRLLAHEPLRYRRQVLALKQHLSGCQCTVLILDDLSDGSEQLRSIAHGVFLLESSPVQFGAERRRLRVIKLRGLAFRSGYHDLVIRTGGLEVFPRLVAADTRRLFSPSPVSSNVPGIDSMLGGGLDRGTSTLILGPSGAGKSQLALQYCHAAAQRGEASSIFTFDENPSVMLARAHGLGTDLSPFVEQGLIQITQVDPAELAPGEFAWRVGEQVLERGARIVVIDSINGYLHAMPEERFLVAQLHELLTFLGQHGVLTLLITAQQGVLGNSLTSPVELTYLADAVLLLRYFELRGEICQALSVVKKRSGNHERTIRQFSMAPSGISVGEPLREFHGVLTGVPILANGHNGANGR